MIIRENKEITLAITQQCNLNCIYCYEDNKSSKVMTFETAKQAIDANLNDERFDGYTIDFFGGEPFLCFDLIRRCVEYTVKTYPEKKMCFMATTNGTLVHGEIKEWLAKHSDIFHCALSLDGPPKMHNINRCNSFDKIDVDFFASHWPDQPMKMTISSKSLPYLAEGIMWMHEHNYYFSANLAYDGNWDHTVCAPIFERELKKLVDYYLAHPEVKPCWLFDLPLFRVAEDTVEEDMRQCGAGIEMISYDIDGRAYPCHFFMPITVGKEKADNVANLEIPEVVLPSHHRPPCRDCLALRICHTCYGVNYDLTGDIFKKDVKMCEMLKIQFKAVAYLRWQQYKLGRLDVPQDQLPYWLKAIKMILKDL